VKLERKLEEQKEELESYESKEPHKFQDKFGEIQSLLKHVQHLETLFTDYDSWLSKIITNHVQKSELSNDQIYYLECIGQYLAKKIGKIRHILTTYDVKKIDVVSKELITKEDAKIHFSDLGTGQGQAAYLETLLNMNENKKVIALFDEVAMMDENTLKPIMQKLRDLYDDNKLLMAIIVQKNDKVTVEDIYGTRSK
jgi:DNA repair protein SbcC/Rad50